MMTTKLARMFEIEEAAAPATSGRLRSRGSDDAVERVLRTCFWLAATTAASEGARREADVIDLAAFRTRLR